MKRTQVVPLRLAFGAMVMALLLAGCTPAPQPTPTPTPSGSSDSGTELGVVVKLVQGTGTEPEKPAMSLSAGADHIRWSNETTETRTIRFSVDWPFMGTKADIVVEPGAQSPWFTVDPSKVGRPYPYDVDPPLVTPENPPDEPSISIES